DEKAAPGGRTSLRSLRSLRETKSSASPRLRVTPSLLMPAHSVALRERNRRARAPAAGVVGPGRQSFALPLRADRIDPSPLRLDLVAPHEQRLVAFEQIEQQPLVGDP